MRLFLIMGTIVLFLLMGHSATAVAPPTVTYSTFLGSDATEEGSSIARDVAGNLYVTGYTESIVFPAPTAVQPQHGIDIFIAKFNGQTGQADYILWFDASSAQDEDYAYGIAVDSGGSAYVTGNTRSADLCTLFGPVPGYDTTYNGNNDIFVMKIKPDGSGLDYCTFLGGDGWEAGQGIVVAADGRATLTGGTWSTDFPTTETAVYPTHQGARDTFITQLSADGTTLLYSTFLGGSGQEEARSIALSPAGQILIGGWSYSTDLPTTANAPQPTAQGDADGFLAQFDPTSNQFELVTYLGGSGEDRVNDLVADDAGAIYLTGITTSSDFPTAANALYPTPPGEMDAFLTQLTSDGKMAYSSYFGGTSFDWGAGLAIDSARNLYLTGVTYSADFPVTINALDGVLNGERDMFTAVLPFQPVPNLHYSSYLGGSNSENAQSILASSPGYIAITGSSSSADYPTTLNANDPTPNGDYDAVITTLILPIPTLATIYLPHLQK